MFVFEPVPLQITALCIGVLLVLTGVSSLKDAWAAYMHPVVVFIMSCLIYAIALERVGITKRMGYDIARKAGDSVTRFYHAPGDRLSAKCLRLFILAVQNFRPDQGRPAGHIDPSGNADSGCRHMVEADWSILKGVADRSVDLTLRIQGKGFLPSDGR